MFFSDIVGFTTISGSLPPEKVPIPRRPSLCPWHVLCSGRTGESHKLRPRVGALAACKLKRCWPRLPHRRLAGCSRGSSTRWTRSARRWASSALRPSATPTSAPPTSSSLSPTTQSAWQGDRYYRPLITPSVHARQRPLSRCCLCTSPALTSSRGFRFSMAALQAAENTLVDEEDCSRGAVQIRIGLNSGPCMVAPNPLLALSLQPLS